VVRHEFFVLLGLCGTAFCQTPDLRRVRADLEFFCSDALAGRVSLSREAEISARYIAADFARAGLRPAVGDSYLQPFPLVAYRSDPRLRGMTLTRAGKVKSFRPGAEFGGVFHRDIHLTAPVVFVGYGITAPELRYDDYEGVDAKGKIALMFDHEPQEDDPRSLFHGTGHTIHSGRPAKIVNARRHGAVAVIVASEPVRKHAGMFDAREQDTTRGQPLRASAPTQALDDDSRLPVFTVSDTVLAELLGENPAEVQRAIESTLRPRSRALPDTVLELRCGNAEQRRGTSYNVAGLIEGSDPALKGETVLLTAHYDHLGVHQGRVYAGANDNASGTAALMELARLFAASGRRPRRSILFLALGSEEQLMLGSFYYAAHPLRPLAGTRAAMTLDMIGRDEAHIPQSQGVLRISGDTSNELNLVGTDYSKGLVEVIERENREIGLKLDTKFDRDHTLNALFRCDHLPFLMEGLPSLWLFGGFHPGYHEPTDTIDRLNFPKMEKVIRLAYRTALAVADGD